MDPLSISSSIVALAGVAATLGNFARSVRNAPKELLSLSSEVSNLNDLIAKLENVRRNEGIPEAWLGNLDQILAPLKLKIEELSAFVNSFESSNTARELLERFKWPITQSKARSLQTNLRDLRLNIITFISINSSADMNLVTSHIVRIGSTIESIYMASQDIQSQIKNGHEKHAQVLSELITQLVPLKEIEAQNADIAKTPNAFLTVAQRSLETYHATAPSPAQQEDQMAIGVRRSWKAACNATCSCCCHRRFRARSPQFLDPLFGALHIEHTSTRINTSIVHCSEKTCVARSNFSAVIQYHFPVWLVARTLSLIIFDAFNLGSPAACLFVQRVISPHHEVFQRVKAGDIDGVKALLTAREVGPNDLHMTARWTALHYAIESGKLEICKLLLDAGADRYLSDGDEGSPFDYAWNTILGRQAEPAVLDGLKNLFISDNGLEHHQFSPLHKIVLGLMHSNLVEFLRASTAGIDKRDARKRTPLYWASRRGDVYATRVLLEHGADPRIGNAHGVLPLHHAACASNPHCIILLLEKGAYVDHRDHRQQIALHYAAFYRNDIAYAMPLLDYKSNVNTQAREGITPLTFAATRDHDRVVRCLLDHGADIELADDYGTPLFNAINFNSHKTIKMLLNEGADCNFRDRLGNTLLHKAAKMANEETLEILLSKTVLSIDADEVNAEGKTAKSLFNDRRIVSDDLIKAWERLIVSCNTEKYYDCMEHSSSGLA